MPGKSKKNAIDEQIEESFPASDPPSFMGGEVLGAPKGRQTLRRTGTRPAARKKPAKKTRKLAKKKPAPKAKRKPTKKKRR